MGVSMCPLVVTMALIILWLGWRWSWIWRYPHDFSFSVTAGANLPPPFPSMRMAASCTKATTANRRRRVGKMCSQVVLLAKVGWKPWGKSRESATTMGTIYIVATWSYVIAKLIFTTNMTIGLMMFCLYIIIHIYIYLYYKPHCIYISPNQHTERLGTQPCKNPFLVWETAWMWLRVRDSSSNPYTPGVYSYSLKLYLYTPEVIQKLSLWITCPEY